MIKIKSANATKDYQQIETLADIIWRGHYIPIIGALQVDYMLDKFQSTKAIEKQIENGFEYFLIFNNGAPIGYISIKQEANVLFLSKIYILSNYRGKMIGKAGMAFIENKAKEYQLKSIRLTVNINNLDAIKAYEKLGYANVGTLVADIGNGFVMDDYEMEKKV